jgi:adiponectin receptor
MDEKPQDANSPVRKVEEKAKAALTVLWNDLPVWMRDNHYIHSGYRPQSNSYSKSAASLAYLHNETVNIFTHIIGAVMAAGTATFIYFSIRPRFHMATREDVLVFSCFFGGAMACLGMSATYHTISNHSEAVAKFGNRLDYIGIVVLIWGSFIPSVYYGFSSEPGLIRVYWTMITTIGAGTLLVVLYPKFRTPAWRPFRAFMFVAMGLSAVVPVLHGIRMYGYKQLERQIGLNWLVSQGALYVIGAVIYAAS